MSHDTNKLQSIATALHGLLVSSKHDPDVAEFFSNLVEGLADHGYCSPQVIPAYNVLGLSTEGLAALVAYVKFSRKDDEILPTVGEFIDYAAFVSNHAEEIAAS